MLRIVFYNFLCCILVCEYIMSSYGPHDQRKYENGISLFSLWDTKNIPESLTNTTTVEELLDILASRRYRSCKASVLFHPMKNIYYFRNPSKSSGSMKDYLPLRCKSFLFRTISLRQRFFLPFKDIEQILDNNEDSILTEGIHEVTELRNGLELSLFPIKFYKSLPLSNYQQDKDLLCFDSIKVLGIDKNSNDYFIISASTDKHRILYCDSFDARKGINLNNFIRYSSYCDEFCAEDYIYFSNDLIKCKCDFFSYVDDLKKNKHFITENLKSENSTENCYYARRLDRYEIFANPYEIAEKLNKHEQQNKPHYRYYLYLIIVLFTFQILYAFYFTTKNSLFIKFTIIFYIILAIIVYVPYRLRQTNLDYAKIFEVISDLYPVLLLIFVSCDTGASGTKQLDIIKLSYIIFLNSFDHILKETRSNEFELILRFVLVISTFIINSNEFINFIILQVRIKCLFEMFSRIFLYMIETNKLVDFAVPFFILLGRPKEYYIMSDHLLFQSNYLKLKPSFEILYENWFMEALNFHRLKNMILFLKVFRYILLMIFLTLFNRFNLITKLISYFTQLRFEKIVGLLFKLSYYNLSNVFYSGNQIVNYFHFPVLLSLIFTNILLTKDCVKIFIIHFFVGLFVVLMTDQKEIQRIRPRANNIRSNPDQGNNQ
jgi:hypothetical protein